MKKWFAYILIFVFVTSTVAETYIRANALSNISFSINETEDSEGGKGIEKESELAKDKFFSFNNINATNITLIMGNYFISHSYLLPHPYIAEEINPPKTAV